MFINLNSLLRNSYFQILISDGNETITEAREVLQRIMDILTASEKSVAEGHQALQVKTLRTT